MVSAETFNFANINHDVESNVSDSSIHNRSTDSNTSWSRRRLSSASLDHFDFGLNRDFNSFSTYEAAYKSYPNLAPPSTLSDAPRGPSLSYCAPSQDLSEHDSSVTWKTDLVAVDDGQAGNALRALGTISEISVTPSNSTPKRRDRKGGLFKTGLCSISSTHHPWRILSFFRGDW